MSACLRGVIPSSSVAERRLSRNVPSSVFAGCRSAIIVSIVQKNHLGFAGTDLRVQPDFRNYPYNSVIGFTATAAARGRVTGLCSIVLQKEVGHARPFNIPLARGKKGKER